MSPKRSIPSRFSQVPLLFTVKIFLKVLMGKKCFSKAKSTLLEDSVMPVSCDIFLILGETGSQHVNMSPCICDYIERGCLPLWPLRSYQTSAIIEASTFIGESYFLLSVLQRRKTMWYHLCGCSALSLSFSFRERMLNCTNTHRAMDHLSPELSMGRENVLERHLGT